MTDAAVRRAALHRLRAGERIVAGLCLAVLVIGLVALARGGARVPRLPWPVLVHVATVIPALAIGSFVLLRPKGLPLHRALGWLFAVLMMTTAAVTWRVRVSDPGRFSFIHLFSLLTLVTVPRLVWNARHRRVDAHRRGVLGLMSGGLVLAGFFTFLPSRLLGGWLFGQ